MVEPGEDPVLDALIAAARERGVPVREVRRGDQVSAAGVKVTVLWPQGRFWSTEDNDNSVALRVEAGEFRATNTIYSTRGRVRRLPLHRNARRCDTRPTHYMSRSAHAHRALLPASALDRR